MYKNIVWIKLEVRLLNDPRWFLMTEEAQLLYVKLLLCAGLHGNSIPTSWEVLRHILRSEMSEADFLMFFEEIKRNFPKVVEDKGVIHIKDFSDNHNQIDKKALLKKCLGYPKVGLDKIREDKSTKPIGFKDVLSYYMLLKKVDGSQYVPFARRSGRAINRLLELCGSVDECKATMDWVAKMCDKLGWTWTLETVEKHYENYVASKSKPSIQPSVGQDITKVKMYGMYGATK